MKLIPAVDLMDGCAVRLSEGDRERATVYARDPASLAHAFAKEGAEVVHLVDLDGAFAGEPTQTSLLGELAATVHEAGAEVQIGGGVRSRAAIDTLFEIGADRVVVGTLAVRDPDTVAKACRAHPGALVVAVDARDGMVAVEGWTETSTVTAQALGERAEGWGAVAVLYTDVKRDGLQGGPAVESTAALQEKISIEVIASGGVGSLDDLDALRSAGIRSVIVGRALYERSFTLKEALARC